LGVAPGKAVCIEDRALTANLHAESAARMTAWTKHAAYPEFRSRQERRGRLRLPASKSRALNAAYAHGRTETHTALSAVACAHGYKSLSDVFLRSELRREDVLDDPFSIDDVGDASWKKPHRFLNRKGPAERPVCIADQRKRQLVLPREGAVLFIGIRADANHVGPGGRELFVRIAKCTSFFCANRSAVLGIKEEHQAAFAQIVRQADPLPVMSGSRKVRRAVANLKSCHDCCPF
jgi:hypothetical protein